MQLYFIVTIPFLGAILIAAFSRLGQTIPSMIAAGSTLVAMGALGFHVPAILAGQTVTSQKDWVPALGLNFSFMFDGLGLLFALLILGIGFLVIAYAQFYLNQTENKARFFAYLLGFQGAMLGIVLSSNLLVLFVFWELTSLTSFLLIGFWTGNAAARQGARMAFSVTSAGGIALFAGFLLLGQAAGSYELPDIMAKQSDLQQDPHYLFILVLILVGAFTKSAQWPFHFWLPQAMAAPTPVSAYLHSATMVKAGIFLLLRLWPVLAGTDIWFYFVVTAGLATMLFGAKVALFSDDLKAILAYSTISHLGLITCLLGLGTQEGAQAALAHILAHALFKAALFMVAGIVDHATHQRDISRLGGLARLMPATALAAGLAAAAMAGLPPMNGFISKEMALSAFYESGKVTTVILPILLTIGAAFSMGYSFRFFVWLFLRPAPHGAAVPSAPPRVDLWAAPFILAFLALATGLFPMALIGGILSVANSAVTGNAGAQGLSLWHGLESAAFWMSVAALGGGLVLLGDYTPLRQLWNYSPKLNGEKMFDAIMLIAKKCGGAIGVLHNQALSFYIFLYLASTFLAGTYAFMGGGFHFGVRANTPADPAAILIWFMLVVASGSIMLVQRDRVVALLLIGVVGTIIAAGFAALAAPDLALTQITVEVVTVILMLLALNFLPKTAPLDSSHLRRLRDGSVAVLSGLSLGAIAYALMLRAPFFEPISAYHLAQSKPLAGGANAVNTIIVDFRGYDTYGEIIVLGIAALIIGAIVDSVLRNKSAVSRLDDLIPPPKRAGDRHPMMMVVATRFLLPFFLMAAVFIFLRGHNLPGGGFVAGLLVTIGFLQQYIASGYAWAQRRVRIDALWFIGLGILAASGAGIGALFMDRAFLTSAHGHIYIGAGIDFEWASASLFDLGVFMCVFGAVLLALSQLSRLAQRGGESVAQNAFDTGKDGA